MKKPKATQILGVLVLAVSGLWVWGVGISPLMRWFGKRGNAADETAWESVVGIEWLSVLGHLGLLTVVSVMIYCGIGLVKNRPQPPWAGVEDFPEEERWRGQIVVDPIVTYVRFSLALCVAVGVVWASAILDDRALGVLPESLRMSMAALLCLLLALPVYVIVVRLLLRGRGYRGVEQRYVIGKGAVGLIAFLLWMATQDVMTWLWPSGETPPSAYDVRGERLIVSMAMFFGPIIVAVVFYHISLHLMRYHQIDLDLRRAGLRSSAELSAVTKSNT